MFENEDFYETLRKRMVEEQIIARGVRDKRVISAMLKVKRHLFLPERSREYAYLDGAQPIDCNQTISQPYIVAVMTEALKLEPQHKVLEIGTGSGYQTAVLAEIANTVYTVERIYELYEKAKKLLSSLGYKNIVFKHGDGYYGFPEYAPYDRIIVTAAPEEVPAPLFEQLNENGIMVAPVGSFYQQLMVYRKENGEIKKEYLFDVRFVPLVH